MNKFKCAAERKHLKEKVLAKCHLITSGLMFDHWIIEIMVESARKKKKVFWYLFSKNGLKSDTAENKVQFSKQMRGKKCVFFFFLFFCFAFEGR